MSGISHFKDENSQKPWFMHAWSETKEREMLTFTGNIKGQCGNRALRANWLPVPVICPYNRDEILIFCHLFSVEMRRGSLFFFPSLSLSPLKSQQLLKTTGSNEAVVTEMLTAKVFHNLNQIQRNIQRDSIENLYFVLDTACKSTSSPALLHFCIKG